MSRTEDLMRSLAIQSGKTEAARLKRKAKRRVRAPSRELWVEWKAAFESSSPGVEVVAWGVVENKLAKDFVKEVGFDHALNVVRHFVSTWSRRKMDGIPNMRILWVMRQRVLSELAGKTAVSQKWENMNNDEWTDTPVTTVAPSEDEWDV
jgi:hypothetical protein